MIVETVGVGQSETAVADMVDMFVLLLLPGGGDDLQGIKRGVIELADLIVVNKADGDLGAQAQRVRNDYAAAIRLLHSSDERWQPKVVTCSAQQGDGIADVWKDVETFKEKNAASGETQNRRADQAKAWMWKEIRESLVTMLYARSVCDRAI